MDEWVKELYWHDRRRARTKISRQIFTKEAENRGMACYFFATIKVTIAPEVTGKALTVDKAALETLAIVMYEGK